MKNPDPQSLMRHDGVILSFRRERDAVLMQYRHYSGEEWELRFTGTNLELYEHDAVGRDDLEGKLIQEGDHPKLMVKDDDGEVAFWIKYDECAATLVGKQQRQ